MIFSRSSSILALFAFISLGTNAYKIDHSCQKYHRLVQTAVEQAFSNGRAAAAALTANPRDANVNRLVKLLFCKDTDDPATKDLRNVIKSFQGIQDGARERFDLIGDEPYETIIYCNIERLRQRADGRYYDATTRTVFDDPDDVPLLICNEERLTLAHTFVPPRFESNIPGLPVREYPSQITICPWFLEWGSGKKYNSYPEITFKGLLSRLAVPLSAKLGPYSPVDAMELFDKVMLHELTHTVSGAQTVDVLNAHSSLVGPRQAYGWKNCRALAEQDPENYLNSARNNADSLALFATGVQLLQRESPVYVTDGGALVANRQTKREITYTGSPAFEGFLTMIKERQVTATGLVNSTHYH